ncbi:MULTISPECIES: ABC transporter permease [unclassified Herbiconiux]|uniref:ABC transporter permease n=1 Tax=unclassified Herbiconiux TaxID=2618217 RepID=UPI001563B2F7|nr:MULTISPECIES: ABC transporter permease [unclassified Herbiconiux]MBF4571184.1 ABC transporter permease [Herbiconiux sp. VKM Ac-1786]NQX36422.1 ABC transporter permease [Herbiconiux sp. VKM Ac-2851]
MTNTTTAAPRIGAPAPKNRAVGSIVQNVRELSVLPGLAIVIVVGALVSPAFLSAANLTLILRQSAELGIVVIGLTFILLTGKLDISLESTVGLAPMVAAWLVIPAAVGGLGTEIDPLLAILITLVIGAGIGLFNGFLVVKVKLDPFIVTLAMLILLRGVTLGISQGKTLAGLPEAFRYIGSARWAGVPAAIWITAILFIIAGLVLRYTSWGRALYAIGGNADAAKAAGVRVDFVLITAFVAASTLAAFAGLMLAGRLASVTSGMGENLIFSALAAAVIGGVQLTGGQGRIIGALMGVLLLGTLTNVLTLAGVPTFWINAVYGAVILIALLVGRFGAKPGLR